MLAGCTEKHTKFYQVELKHSLYLPEGRSLVVKTGKQILLLQSHEKSRNQNGLLGTLLA